MIEHNSYICHHSILGMMSSRYKLIETPSLQIIKNKNSVILFSLENLEYFLERYEKVSIAYLNELPEKDFKYKFSKYSLTSIIGGEFNDKFFKLEGKDFTELRETRNKFDRKLIIKTELNDIKEVLELVDKWDERWGKEKYGWIRHSGYDRSFFINHYEKEKENLFCRFFYDKDTNEFVGYSVLSRQFLDNPSGKIYPYIIRKYLPEYSRNLCLYIDFKTFQELYLEIKNPYFCHWGGSSSSLLAYKTTKFPYRSLKKIWFISIKK